MSNDEFEEKMEEFTLKLENAFEKNTQMGTELIKKLRSLQYKEV